MQNEHIINGLIKTTLGKIEELGLPAEVFTRIRHLVIRIAFDAMLAGFNSSEKNGNNLER